MCTALQLVIGDVLSSRKQQTLLFREKHGREIPVVGGKQQVEVALSRLLNCPSVLLLAASGVQGEPRFIGCN